MMIQDRYFKMYLKDSLKPYNLNSAEGIVLLMMFKSMSETDKATEKEKAFVEEVTRVTYERDKAERLGLPLDAIKTSFAS